MYHRVRQSHRWIGLLASLFLLMLALTGGALAVKGKVAALRPPEVKSVGEAPPRVTVAQAMAVAFAVGHPELSRVKDVDRVDYRPKSNLYKVVSKEGYREVQIDGETGRVSSDAIRMDAWVEDLHDLSFFNEGLHEWGLPTVAVSLAALALSGVGIFFVPVYRRWAFRRQKGRKGA